MARLAFFCLRTDYYHHVWVGIQEREKDRKIIVHSGDKDSVSMMEVFEYNSLKEGQDCVSAQDVLP